MQATEYFFLYSHLKNARVESGRNTFVFPAWLRELLRARFNTDGKYDEQYENRNDVYYVTNNELLDLEWTDTLML